MPVINLSPEVPDGQNNWYKVPVNVTLTTDNENNKEIHYRIVRNGITKPEEEDIKYTGSFTIDTLRNNRNICMVNRRRRISVRRNKKRNKNR